MASSYAMVTRAEEERDAAEDKLAVAATHYGVRVTSHKPYVSFRPIVTERGGASV